MTGKWKQRSDDEQPHQIRLFWAKTGGTVGIAVGCTCRRGRFGLGFDPIVVLANEGDSPWPYYNDPASHNGDGVKYPLFVKGDQRGSYAERAAAPEAPVQRTVADALLAELDDQDMEGEHRHVGDGDLLPV